MTYNVFSGTLNPSQSVNQSSFSSLPFQLPSGPLNLARGLGSAVSSPQRARAEPDPQTIFGEFRALNGCTRLQFFSQLTVRNLRNLVYTE